MPNLTKKEINKRWSNIKKNFSSYDLKFFDKDALIENYELLFDKDNKLTNQGKCVIIYSKLLVEATDEATKKGWDKAENRNEQFDTTVAQMAMGKIELPGQPSIFANPNIEGGYKCLEQGKYLAPIHEATLLLANKSFGYNKDEFVHEKVDYYNIAHYAKDNMQRSIKNQTDYYNKLINVYNNLPNEKSPGFDEQKLYFGVEIINEIAKNHYNREKPGFFAKLFKTKSFKEYDAEAKKLNDMIDKVNKVNDKNYDLNIFKDKDSFERNEDTIKDWKSGRGKWPSTVAGAKAQLLIDGEVDKATYVYQLTNKTLEEKLKDNLEEFHYAVAKAEDGMPIDELNPNFRKDVCGDENEIVEDDDLVQEPGQIREIELE